MARRRTEPPLDPFERAARRSDPDYALLAEAGDAADAAPPPGQRATRLLVMFGVLVAALALANGGRNEGPALKPSCTKAAFALGSSRVLKDAPMAWSAVGPEQGSVAFSLDSPVRPSVQLLDGPTPLHGCSARGSFPFRATRGEHRVTAYLLAADGSSTVIATRTVTVS